VTSLQHVKYKHPLALSLDRRFRFLSERAPAFAPLAATRCVRPIAIIGATELDM
jgi:hypothetical protein